MTVRPLPVPTRIFGGEGLISYATRHATRNGTSVEDIERAFTHGGAIRMPRRRQSPEREQTWRELGALHHSAFRTPARFHGAEAIDRPLCLRCTDGTGGTGRLPHVGWVCLRHRRWIGTPQHDIHALPELAAAEHRYRRHLVPRGALVGSPIMEMARDCSIVGTGRSVLAQRARRAGTSDPDLLTYPETVRVARLITSPAFNAHMLQAGLNPGDRHALSLRLTARLFPEPEDNESWRAANRITAMFNGIARELEMRMSSPPPGSMQTPDATLASAWTIWGK
jgi:hypothetical protein